MFKILPALGRTIMQLAWASRLVLTLALVITMTTKISKQLHDLINEGQ